LKALVEPKFITIGPVRVLESVTSPGEPRYYIGYAQAEAARTKFAPEAEVVQLRFHFRTGSFIIAKVTN
jgi:hypothetical protein